MYCFGCGPDEPCPTCADWKECKDLIAALQKAPQEVRVCHASTPPGEYNPTAIVVADDIPLLDNLDARRDFFQEQASLIVGALESSLPGGVRDRVMAEMMHRWSRERLLSVL
jgi:hypothetical protein